MRQDYYLYQLDDYGLPSFVSGLKPYFGTINDFRALYDELEEDQLGDLQNTFEHFACGERSIIHSVAMGRARFAYRISKRYEREFDLRELTYNYENTYGFYYSIRMTRAVGKVCIFKHNRKFYTAIWAKIEKPRYSNKLLDGRRWSPLGDMIWGHPGVIKANGRFIENTLGIMEGKFNSEEEAREHLQSFSNLNWNPYYADIFGDG